MRTKSVPAIVMLSAGFIACMAGIRAHMEVAGFMKMLLVVLILFYILGCVVKMILDHNFKEAKDEGTTDGEAPQEEAETAEEAMETADAGIEKE